LIAFSSGAKSDSRRLYKQPDKKCGHKVTLGRFRDTIFAEDVQ